MRHCNYHDAPATTTTATALALTTTATVTATTASSATTADVAAAGAGGAATVPLLVLLLMDEILHRFSSTAHPFQTLNLSIDAKPLLKKACRRMDEILHHVSVSSTLTLEG